MMMKGMTMQEFTKVVEFAQKYHPFGGISGGMVPLEHQRHIKYIDSIYDSRFQIVWNITFRGMGTSVQFRTNHFAGGLNKKPADFKYETLQDWIMHYLTGKWSPSKSMAEQMHVDN